MERTWQQVTGDIAYNRADIQQKPMMTARLVTIDDAWMDGMMDEEKVPNEVAVGVLVQMHNDGVYAEDVDAALKRYREQQGITPKDLDALIDTAESTGKLTFCDPPGDPCLENESFVELAVNLGVDRDAIRKLGRDYQMGKDALADTPGVLEGYLPTVGEMIEKFEVALAPMHLEPLAFGIAVGVVLDVQMNVSRGNVPAAK